MSRRRRTEYPVWYIALLTLLPAVALVSLCIGAAIGNSTSVLAVGCVSTLVGVVIKRVLASADGTNS